MYIQCRSLQLVQMDIPKGSGKQQKVLKLTVPFPTGYSILPWEGGMLDQPYRLMEFFNIFMSAERASVFEKMK